MVALRRVLLLAGSAAFVANCDEVASDDVNHYALNEGQLRRLHGELDANGDGKVSLDEIMSVSDRLQADVASKDIRGLLMQLDANKDDRVSLEEYDGYVQRLGESPLAEGQSASELEHERLKFKTADVNGDGLLDSRELTRLLFPETDEGVLDITTAATLKNKDTNGDGKLSPEELWENLNRDAEEQQAHFKMLDKDQDGFLGLKELKAWETGNIYVEQAMTELLDLADRDGDRRLDADELEAARKTVAKSDAHAHLAEWAAHLEL